MHEPDIAPLARRLAEENNVDWRRLSGSGDGGRIVERDVLAYLARVMAGEESVDPTPEPVPDGMEAWPEADVAGYGGERVAAEEAEGSPPTLDDELFLFDEEPSPSEEAATPEPPAVDRPDDPADDDAVWLVGDDVPAEATAATTPAADDLGYDDLRFGDLPDLTAETTHAASTRGDLPVDDDPLALPDLFAAEPMESEPTGDVDPLFSASLAPGAPTEANAAESAPPLGDQPAWYEMPVPAAATARDEASSEEAAPAAEVVETVAADAAAASAVTALDGAPWVRHGQVWRRRFDERALRRAASEVATALDAAPASVVALLLARAAVRAGMSGGPVALWRWRDGGEEWRATDWASDVRSIVHRLEGPADHERAEDATLVVADLSPLGVDEAVLHLDAPVLALGRAVGDGTWLTYSGDGLDGSAAGALARVAELLSAPSGLLV